MTLKALLIAIKSGISTGAGVEKDNHCLLRFIAFHVRTKEICMYYKK